MDSEIQESDKSADALGKLISGIDEKQTSALALAYVGDSVYELAVRTLALERSNTNVNYLDTFVKKFTNAKAQAKVVQLIAADFSEQEMRVFKRGRNAKSVTAPHTCSISEYRRATGLECLAGYLYLQGNADRAAELVKKGIELYERSEQ